MAGIIVRDAEAAKLLPQSADRFGFTMAGVRYRIAEAGVEPQPSDDVEDYPGVAHPAICHL